MSVLTLNAKEYNKVVDTLLFNLRYKKLNFYEFKKEVREDIGAGLIKKEEERRYLKAKVFNWMRRLFLYNQFCFANQYELKNRDEEKTVELTQFKYLGREEEPLILKDLKEKLTSLKYNLEDNNGRLYCSEKDYSVLNSVLTQIREELLTNKESDE